jgi:hypothetical protein
MLIFRDRLSNEKIRQSPLLPSSNASEERTAELETKPAVVPVFGLKFGETEICTCLPLKPLVNGNFIDLSCKHLRNFNSF